MQVYVSVVCLIHPNESCEPSEPQLSTEGLQHAPLI